MKYTKILSLAAFASFGLSAGSAAIVPVDVPVGNASFETTGTDIAGDPQYWHNLPAGGDWTKSSGAGFDIYDTSPSGDHLDSAPDGVHVLNLNATYTQDLEYAINVGDVITLDFWVGRSLTNASGNLTASILVDGLGVNDTFTNPNSIAGAFTAHQTQFTATSSGNLSIQFAKVSGTNFIDAVSVNVVPEPGSFALIGGCFALASVMLRRRRS